MEKSANHQVDNAWMGRALELARRGQGLVEPNPMVGCVIVRDGELLSEGWHQHFGGLHAEANALNRLMEKGSPTVLTTSGSTNLEGATVYVTLEPCCHFGKTPPCVDRLLLGRPSRVVIGLEDPFPEMRGKSISLLREAGIEVTVGVLQVEAEAVMAPYLKRQRRGLPWVIGKWAMSLDGKIATRTGSSQWISNADCREVVHRLRGRMDAIVVGIETALTDDPMLTVRPPGLRVPLRVIIDSRARLPIASRLVQSRNEGLVIVVCGPDAKPESVAALRDSGCEVLQIESNERSARLEGALRNLSGRGCTNVLVEGGGTLLGDFLDRGWIDEVHAFIAPLLLGGADAPSPIAGHGVASVAQGMRLESPCFEWLNGNIYLHGLTSKSADVSLPEST